MDPDGRKKVYVTWGVHWRHLANTIERYVCGGYAAFFSNYFDHLLVSSDVTNDEDIQREISNMFIRTNVLFRTFYNCSTQCKKFCFLNRMLFVCMMLLGGRLTKLAPWPSYVHAITCVPPVFFGYKRYDSITSILFLIGYGRPA